MYFSSHPCHRTCEQAATLLAVLLVSACASAPKPAVPDGTSRVPVNDPARVAQFQQQSAAEVVAVNTQITLQSELAVCKKQLDDWKVIVYSALAMPKETDRKSVV